MARFEHSRVAKRGRTFALIAAVAFAGACGDDSGDDGDGRDRADTGVRDGGNRDGGRDAATDGGSDMDAGRDGGGDAGRDAAVVDAGPLAMAGDDAPTLTKIGFFNDELGRRILISGSDKNGDIATYTVSFFSKDDGTVPVEVDTDGDSTTPGSATFTGTIAHDTEYQDFLAKFPPSQEVIDLVKSIKVTVKDGGGRESASQTAKLMPAPQVGGACDPNGFNRCSTNSVCAPTNTGAYSCSTVMNARQTACTSSSVLTLTAPGSVDGTFNNASFWDWPSGCAGGDTMNGFPDRVVKVKVTAQAAKLTLSTGGLMGPVDTVIYQLPTAQQLCTANPTACGDNGCDGIAPDTCSDGDLVLSNVAPGDYYIVVDSFPPRSSDTFTLTATVE